MKKRKSKSRNHSKTKKLRKEFEIQLTDSFNEVIHKHGTTKKSQNIIEKFAKQLAKKVSFKTDDKSITHFVKEDQLPENKVIEVVAVKEIIKKAKVTKPAKSLITDK